MLEQSPHLAMARARQALQTAGLHEPSELVRASSTRNEVFVGDTYVVRINRQLNQRLRREAGLYRHLPRRDWTPEAIKHGGEVGADFLIVARKPGHPLARYWPNMTKSARRDAIRQLADVLRELHATPTPASLARVDATTHLIDPRCVTPLVPLLMALDELKSRPAIDKGLMHDTEQLVLGLATALDDYDQRTLIHGDLTFENVLWDGHKVSGLLDFEWCRGASNDLDLDVLFRFCAFPFAHVAEDYEAHTKTADYIDVPSWLSEDLPELFAHPRLADRLLLYCLAFDVHDLMESPPIERSALGPLHPLNRIRAAASTGGHVSAMLRRMGVTV